jgi:pyruvate,orthophosphate dikinase
MDKLKAKRKVKLDTELTAEDLRELVVQYKALIRRRLGKPFPEKPMDQLWGAVGAVFSSWDVPRAVSYRQIHGIPDDWGTAVNVQSMVFGNMGDDSRHRRGLHPGPGHGRELFLW